MFQEPIPSTVPAQHRLFGWGSPSFLRNSGLYFAFSQFLAFLIWEGVMFWASTPYLPQNSARLRLALLRSALLRLASFRSARLRLASMSIALVTL